MARTPKSPKQVSTLTHDEARRRNIPTAELQATAEYLEEMRPAQPVRYRRARPLPTGDHRKRDEDLDPRVICYVKNQGMQFDVLYRDGALPRRYVPDFIVRLDDGADEPLNLILETKRFRSEDAQLKAETMNTLWVPGVNNLGAYGRWAFEEFRDVYAIEETFNRLVDRLTVAKEFA